MLILLFQKIVNLKDFNVKTRLKIGPNVSMYFLGQNVSCSLVIYLIYSIIADTLHQSSDFLQIWHVALLHKK